MEEENNNIQNQENIYYGILDKIQVLKEPRNREVMTTSLAIIKTSNDPEIVKLSNLVMNNSKNHNNAIIGLRKIIKIIQKESSATKLEIYEYNYLVSKKFKYLCEEAIENAEILLIVVNIFDKKCFDNLKLLINEIIKYGNNMQRNVNDNGNNIGFNSTSEITLNKKIRFLLLKTTNNFLMKITEPSSLISAKTEITNLFKIIKNLNYKFVEVDIDEIKETNNLLTEIIN